MMLQTRSRTIVAAGVAVALIGAAMVFVYVRSVTGSSGPGPSVSAFVASRDIPAGTSWEAAAGAVTQRSVPSTLRPASAITTAQQLAGRKAVRRISAGEVVTTAQFGVVKGAPGAGLEIPPGHNAVTIDMPPPRGVAGYPQPGDLLNIFVTLRDAGGQGAKTKLLLSNVQLLANRSAGAEQQANVASSGQSMLTLALTPDQAEKVVFAKENGSLWFGLVRPGDKPATTAGRNAQNVLS